MARRSQRFQPPDLPPAGGVITSLTTSRSAPDLVTIRLGRRTAGRITEQQARRLGIEPGVEWTDHLRSAVATAMMTAEARDWAARSASRRPMSKSMLAIKLRQRGLEQAPAARIAEDLAAKGVINERAFAEGLVESTLARRAAGKRLLTTRLRSRGIDSRTAGEAVERITRETGYDARASALELARRRLRVLSPRLDADAKRRRIYGLLARRGFDADVCREVIEALLKDHAD